MAVGGEGSLEVVDLPAEVSALVFTGDSSIEEDLFRGRGPCGSVGWITGVKELFDVSRVIEVLATWGGDGAQLALCMPSRQSLTTDSIRADDRCWGEVVNVPYCD